MPLYELRALQSQKACFSGEVGDNILLRVLEATFSYKAKVLLGSGWPDAIFQVRFVGPFPLC